MGNVVSVMWHEASNKNIREFPFYVLDVLGDFELQVRNGVC